MACKIIFSDFYILYKRKILHALSIFIVFMSLLILLHYSRYNFIYPDIFDYRHINAINFPLNSILENSLFTFNILTIILTLFIFDLEHFDFLYFYRYNDLEIFLSKIFSIFILISLYLTLYFFINLLIGVTFFDTPKNIYVHYSLNPISINDYWIYSLKYYLALLFLLFILSSINLLLYINIKNKLFTFLITIAFIIGQVYFPKYSILLNQIELKKIIINNLILYLFVYFSLIIFFLILSFYLFKRDCYFKTYFFISLYKFILK